jgi:S1-C subfamily serine protease
MSAPKHLWSGDWQQESAASAQELAGRQVKPLAPEPAVSPPPGARARRRPGLSRALPILLVVGLVLAAGAYGLSALLNSSATPPAIAGARSGPAGPTTASASSRPVSWLGMELETVPPAAAAIVTVAPGSAGELAGLEPGDVIVEVNHRNINGAGGIATAIQGLHAGDLVELRISHGSALYTTEATLAAPPSVYP